MKLIACVFLLFIELAVNSFGAVNIPITIQETLPAGVGGVDRANEVATSGIPLPEGSGITSVSQLGLSGAVSGQFRALGYWPNGDIKWVLVDVPVSVSAGAANNSIALVDGSGNFGGSNLATDGSVITISTGTATFTVKKSNFNLFDTVTVGATPLVSTGNAGKIRMIGKDDTEYTSSNDSSSTATIEENGPVRAVVKSTGSLKSSSGVRLMDYTVRLHFYKNKSSVKGAIELRHASKTNAYLTRDFKSVEAVVPVAIGATKTVAFGKDGASLTNSLPTSATAYLMQGFTPSRVPYSGNVTANDGLMQSTLPGISGEIFKYDPTYMGLKIAVGATSLSDFRTDLAWLNSGNWATDYNDMYSKLGTNNRADGFASINDSTGKGVTLAYRNLSDWWPGGFELKDSGVTSIELYSKYNNRTMKLGFGQHDSREVMWDFHTTNADDRGVNHSLAYPLTIRAPFSHYASTKAIYGQSEFVTETEQQSVFSALATSVYPVPNTSPSLANPETTVVYKGWPWSEGGGWNQINAPGDDMLDYLRTGRGGFYLRAETRSAMVMDSGLGRSDDFVTESFSVDAEGQSWPKTVHTGSADGEHSYVYSLPLYYYLSGNESAKDAWLDYGDRLLRNELIGYYQLPDSQWLRGISNTIRNAAIIYEFSCEQGSCNNALKAELEGTAAFQIDSRATGSYGLSGRGRDMNRGLIYWDTDVQFGGANKRLVHSIYHSHIHFEAMYQLWRVMGQSQWSYSRRQELEDYMTGLAKFYLDEWLEVPPGATTVGAAPYNFKYALHYDMLLDESTPYTGQGELVPYSFGRAAVWAYQHSGDPTYLDKGANMVWEQPAYSGDSVRNPSELQDQGVMWAYLNQSSIKIWKPLAVSVQDNGGGSYTVTWTVPEGAELYQIKYSGKPIVEWLNFNKDTRSYQYDPSKYTPFFAATNISSPPKPSTPGTIQSITLSDFGSGVIFSAKYIDELSSLDQSGKHYKIKSIRKQD